MQLCNECNFFLVYDGLNVCNHPDFEFDPLSLDMDGYCEGFKRLQNREESVIDLIINEEIDSYMYSEG